MSRKKKRPILPYEKGDYLRKANYTPILGTGLPVLKVRNVSGACINGRLVQQGTECAYIKISEKEAFDLMHEWNEISISSTPVKDKPNVCIVKATGLPKEPISPLRIKDIFFHYKKAIQPKITAYMCPKCGHYHLGKLKQNGEEKPTPNTWLTSISKLTFSSIYKSMRKRLQG